MTERALGAEEFAGLLRGCMSTAVRLAITRHNLELDPDAASEEDIADDAAGACFGEECCDDKPISEVVQLLAYAASRSGAEERLREALRSLRNEVHGSLEICDTEELARMIGWTNLHCIENRITEADALFADLAGGNKEKE